MNLSPHIQHTNVIVPGSNTSDAWMVNCFHNVCLMNIPFLCKDINSTHVLKTIRFPKRAVLVQIDCMEFSAFLIIQLERCPTLQNVLKQV